MIRPMEKQDIPAWLALAEEVEPLFGEMAGRDDFKNGIAEYISNLSAFCAVNSCHCIEGIIAVNKVDNEIAWLAVRESSRGKGYGYGLLEVAIDCLDNTKPMFVRTFSPDVKAGEAARKLYRRFGFKDYKDGGKNPAGIDTVIMRKP